MYFSKLQKQHNDLPKSFRGKGLLLAIFARHDKTLRLDFEDDVTIIMEATCHDDVKCIMKTTHPLEDFARDGVFRDDIIEGSTGTAKKILGALVFGTSIPHDGECFYYTVMRLYFENSVSVTVEVIDAQDKLPHSVRVKYIHQSPPLPEEFETFLDKRNIKGE